jgi:UDP-glucose 4-epimerase
MNPQNHHILITGGAGFIGSQVNANLQRLGYKTVVIDNLSRGVKTAVVDGELRVGELDSRSFLESIFEKYSISAVMHFAAWTEVAESFQVPLSYYSNNVCSSLLLFEMMVKHQVKRLIFSSSAAIFGLPEVDLIDESHQKEPINPYGRSKLIVEQILSDLDDSNGIKSSCLRYFNAAGGDPLGEIPQDKSHLSNLIPIVLDRINRDENHVCINGNDYPTRDGSCVRDYVHIDDIAQAHILALEDLEKEGVSSQYNLGNGNGFSNFEVVEAVKRVTGSKIDIKIGPRRQGDPPQLLASSTLAREKLHWKPKYPELEVMIGHAWAAMKK